MSSLVGLAPLSGWSPCKAGPLVGLAPLLLLHPAAATAVVLDDRGLAADLLDPLEGRAQALFAAHGHLHGQRRDAGCAALTPRAKTARAPAAPDCRWR